jgi:hypothetical protein
MATNTLAKITLAEIRRRLMMFFSFVLPEILDFSRLKPSRLTAKYSPHGGSDCPRHDLPTNRLLSLGASAPGRGRALRCRNLRPFRSICG